MRLCSQVITGEAERLQFNVDLFQLVEHVTRHLRGLAILTLQSHCSLYSAHCWALHVPKLSPCCPDRPSQRSDLATRLVNRALNLLRRDVLGLVEFTTRLGHAGLVDHREVGAMGLPH